MEIDEEFLQNDKTQHPDCWYSSSKSMSCRTINGEKTCENICKIFRQCPGERPKEIMSQTEKTECSSDTIDSKLHSPFQEGESFDPFSNIMKDIFSQFSAQLGGAFEKDLFFGHSKHSLGEVPLPRAPHHFPKGKYPQEDESQEKEKQQSWNPFSKSTKKKKTNPFEGYSGHVEEA